jgi:hemolysin D
MRSASRPKFTRATAPAPPAAPPDGSDPKRQELVYAARISLDRTAMEIEGRSVDQGPGMV